MLSEKKLVNTRNNLEKKELDSCVTAIVNMLKQGISMLNLPIVVLADNVTTQVDVFLEIYDESLRGYGTYPEFIRTSQIKMEFPQNMEDEDVYKTFYEAFNSFSRHQNRTYGVANISFRKWKNGNITDTTLRSLFEFMTSNKGNCAFVLSDVPQGMIQIMKKEVDGYFLFVSNKEELSSSKFIEAYCLDKNMKIPKELRQECEKILNDVPQKYWEKRVSEFCFLIYQCSEFNNTEHVIHEFKQKIREENQERKIGFCM